MPTEIATFTPRIKTGSAQYIDFWNADLYDGDSHLTNLYERDQIRFRKDAQSWRYGFNTKHPNGIIQAFFDMPANDYFLGILKMSGEPLLLTVYVDDEWFGWFNESGTGVEIPITADLSKGLHAITVLPYIQTPIATAVGKHDWFHSLVCFTV